jgi:trehalose 6-phosphate synthase
MPNTKGSSVVETLADHELFVASNREPYVHDYRGEEVTVSQPAGGLTAALDPIMQRLSGTWVAWGSGEADFEVADDQGRIEVPQEDPSYTIQRLSFSERELSGYYYGYSNQVLWPLCHGMPTLANFDGEFWWYYREINARFADAIEACADTDDPAIWFQDYHLALAPRLVRERLPSAFLTQFWHVPWPSWDTYRSCPQSRQLLEGLLGNDVLGFHSESYCEAFFECVGEAFDDATVDEAAGRVSYDDHTTQVQCCPLPIDAEAQHADAKAGSSDRSGASFTGTHDLGDRVAVGVDRLDYTKGILKRLDALEWLWQYHPERQGTFTYVQKASPSRTRIEEYRTLQTDVERRVDEINDRFGSDGWDPIVYTDDHYSRAELASLYRHADVGIVSPLRDGMNLVAKEYVASQVDDDGVLVLSPFAGAAESLGDAALVVNPNDTLAFASTIEAALSMPPRTRRRHIRELSRRVHSEDIGEWIREQFCGIEAPRESSFGQCPRWQATPVSVWSRKEQLRDELQTVDGLFVMTDFDGTIADIVAEPDQAEIHERARGALETFAVHPQAAVAVISGREAEDIRQRVGVSGVYYAGNHGLELYDRDGRLVHSAGGQALDVLEGVTAAAEQRFDGIEGVFVEDKRMTVTVHYRQAGDVDERVLAAVRGLLDEHDEQGVLCITEGREVVEIRPDIAWDKGHAVELLQERFTPDDERWIPVYIGDDTTDETAFETVSDDGIAVAVGPNEDVTAAPYVVRDPDEATDFLEWLAETGLSRLGATRRRDTVVETR